MIPIPAILAFLRGWKLWAALGLVAALGVGVAMGVRHYRGMQLEIESLRQSTENLRAGLDVQRESTRVALSTIQEWEDAQARLVRRVEELGRVQRAAAAELRRVDELFRELEGVGPEVAAGRVTSATARLLRLLECASAGEGGPCEQGAGATGPPPAATP